MLNILLIIAITAGLMLVAYLLVSYPILLGIYLAACTVAPFFLPPIKDLVGAPIVFFHVPLARVCAIGFLLAAWYGLKHLSKRDPEDDVKSAAAVEVGFVFAFLATVTGAFFSKLNWGAYWSWDPRQTSAFLLLLIYGAYLALRASFGDSDTRARLSAVYAILAFFSAIFLIFVYPYLFNTLHPSVMMQMDAVYKRVLYSTMLGYAGLWVLIFRNAVAVMKMEALAKAQASTVTAPASRESSTKEEVTWSVTRTSS